MTTGFEYTVATGRLFCPVDEFHRDAEALLGRPIFTHEFATAETWDALRAAMEERLTDEFNERAAA